MANDDQVLLQVHELIQSLAEVHDQLERQLDAAPDEEARSQLESSRDKLAKLLDISADLYESARGSTDTDVQEKLRELRELQKQL
jgi:hypothetical protein